MTGVAGGDIPTTELTAAKVGDIATDETLFGLAGDGCALVLLSVTNGRAFVAHSVDGRPVFEPMLAVDGRVLVPPLSSSRKPVLTRLSRCFFKGDRGISDGSDGVGG